MKRQLLKRVTAALLAVVLVLSNFGNIPVVLADEVQVRADANVQMSSDPEVVYVNAHNDATVREQNFDENWKFYLGEASGAENVTYDDSRWENVNLPHDYSIEQEYTAAGEAESGYLLGGTGWYRKYFTLEDSLKDKEIRIDFGGVYMNSTVWVNGTELGTHPYGYTPFSFDITDYVKFGKENVITVKVDHQTPSSRWYSGSGIYRSVNLTIMDKVHVDLYGTKIETPNLETEQGGTVNMSVATTVVNAGATAADVVLTHTIYEKDTTNSIGTVTTAAQSVDAGASAKIDATLPALNPKLWSIGKDNAHLYTVVTEVKVGDVVVDTYETEYGFRYINFDTHTGFSLNGQNMKLKGVCMHHDQGALGSEAHYRAIERQVEILQEMGCNSIRVTHNPAANELIEICNEKGILVVEEAFDGWMYNKNGNSKDYSEWFEKAVDNGNLLVGADAAPMAADSTDNILGAVEGLSWAQFDLTSMIKRGQNSPAIIMWSLGNEVWEGAWGAGDFPKVAKTLISWATALDSSRPSTIGDNKLKESNSNSFAMSEALTAAGGITGSNYCNGAQYDTVYNRYKNVENFALYGSETASHTNSRGVYYTRANNSLNAENVLTSYDDSAVGWGATASRAWYDVITRDYVAGEYVWTGFDYIGEPTPANGTDAGYKQEKPTADAPKNSYFGIIDTAGLPKDNYYFYQSQWNDEVVTLHVLPAWNSDSVVSGDVPIVVYSDAAAVELFFTDADGNRESLGKKTFTAKTSNGGNYTYQIYEGLDANGTTDKNLYLTWYKAFEEGTIEAVAYDTTGNVISDTVGRSMVKTTGEAAKLAVSVDRNEIKADGKDLAYIKVDVTDAEGNIVPNASNNVKFVVEGNGVLVGVDNGKQPDHQSFQDDNRDAFSGSLIAIVQSEKAHEDGSFTVRAISDGLTEGIVTVTTKAVAGEGVETKVDSFFMSKNYYVKKNNTPQLPETIETHYTDGTQKDLPVVWGEMGDVTQTGTFILTGEVTDEAKSYAVSVVVNVIDEVGGLLNYSTTTAIGKEPVLPDTRQAVLVDGTILNASFPVAWDEVPVESYAQAGTFVVNGTATVLGEAITVTASVRVQEEHIEISGSIDRYLDLVQDIPEELQSDTLTAIWDGNTVIDANSDGGANESMWTNYTNSQAGDNTAEIVFNYATQQRIGEIVIHFAKDSYATEYPDAGTTEIYVSETGAEDSWVKVNATETLGTENNNVKPYTYSFAPVAAVYVKFCFTNSTATKQVAACTGITEIEMKKATGSYTTNTTAELASLTVNGTVLTAAQISKDEYFTLDAYAEVAATGKDNAAVTVLPVYNDNVVIIMESEDHLTRESFTVHFEQEAPLTADGTEHDIPVSLLSVTAGDQHNETEGASKVLDNNVSTIWHTNWYGTSNVNHYIDFEISEDYVVNGLRYLPRNSGGSNGIITKYRVLVSNDKVNWEQVAEGNWEADRSWKLAAFEGKFAKYVRLVSVEAVTDQNYVFASAAEIRLTGKKYVEPGLTVPNAPIEAPADAYEIYPIPQAMQYYEGSWLLGTQANVVYENGIDDATKARLEETMALKGISVSESDKLSETKVNVLLGIYGSEGFVDQYVKETLKPSGRLFTRTDAYLLATVGDKIVVLGKDTDAVFYGLTSLYHIFAQTEGREIYNFTMEDYADVVSRGFIEGYYGNPWSVEDRMELMEWGGYYKLNSYFYAPKDDPKHNAKWRELYTQEELDTLIKPLADAGNASKCRFVFALHPYMNNPIRYSSEAVYQEDLAIMQAKFAQVIEAGVRQIAILADDAGNVGGTNYIRTLEDMTDWISEMQVTYPDLKITLPFCTQEYMYNGESYYANFPENVQIVMTGGRVWGEVSESFTTTFTNNVGRGPYLWVNWPCTDNSKKHLIMGGYSTFLHPNVNPSKIEGIVLNPMQQSEPSKVAIFGNAAYSWNIWESVEEADKAWEDSFAHVDHISAVETRASEALKELSKHMINQNMDSRVTALQESVEIKETLNSFKTRLATGTVTEVECEEIIAIFEELQNAAEIYAASGNSRIKNQIVYWLNCWADTTDAAIMLLEAVKADLVGDSNTLLTNYNAGSAAFAQSKTYGFHYVDHTEYAEVGVQHIVPFIGALESYVATRAEILLNPDALITTYITSRTDTPTGSVENILDGNEDTKAIYKSPNQIVQGDYVGLLFSKVIDITNVKFVLGAGKDHFDEARVEYTMDGTVWTALEGTYAGVTNQVQRVELTSDDLPSNFQAMGIRLVATRDNANDAWMEVRDICVNVVQNEEISYDNLFKPSDWTVYQSYGEANLYDGNDSTYVWYNTGNGDTYDAGDALGYNFGRVFELESAHIVVGNDNGDKFVNYTVETSVDGTTWTAVPGYESYTGSTSTKDTLNIQLNGLEAQYIRIRALVGERKWVKFSEFTVTTVKEEVGSTENVYTNMSNTAVYSVAGEESIALTGETITVAPGEYIGIDLKNIKGINAIETTAATGDVKLQTSMNGIIWEEVGTSGTYADARYIRLANYGAEDANVAVEGFKVTFDNIASKSVDSDMGGATNERDMRAKGNVADLFDGNLSTYGEICSAQTAGGHITFDLGQTIALNSLRYYIVETNHDFLRHAKFEVSANGTDWEEILVVGSADAVNMESSSTAKDAPYLTHDSSNPGYMYIEAKDLNASVRYIRIVPLTTYTNRWMQFNEIQINGGAYFSIEDNRDIVSDTIEVPYQIPSNALDNDFGTYYENSAASGSFTYRLSKPENVKAIRLIQVRDTSNATVTAEFEDITGTTATTTAVIGTLDQTINEFNVPDGMWLKSVTVTWNGKAPVISEILGLTAKSDASSVLNEIANLLNTEVNADNWTKATREAYEAARANAEAAKDSAYISQVSAQSILVALERAIENGVERYTSDALELEVNNALSNQDGAYTASSYSVYEEALTNAQIALNDKDNLSAVDGEALYNAIVAAKANLVYTTVNREIAQVLVTNMSKYTDETQYADELWTALQNAKQALEALLVADTDENRVNPSEYVEAIENAEAVLAHIGNIEDLKAELERFASMDANVYTEESWNVYATAAEAAENLPGTATAEEVVIALQTLIDAYHALEEKPPVIPDYVITTENVNHVKNATMTSSSNEVASFGPGNTNDGDDTTRWSSASATTTNTSEWLKAEFEEPTLIKHVRVYFHTRNVDPSPSNVSRFDIKYIDEAGTEQTAKANCVVVASGNGYATSASIVLEDAVIAKAIKLANFRVKIGSTQYNSIGITEFQAFSNEILPGTIIDLDSLVDSLEDAENPVIENGTFTLPVVPEGYTIELNGADFEQILGKDLTVVQPLTDKEIQISYKVSDGEETVITRDITYLVKGKNTQAEGMNTKPVVIPEIQEWYSESTEKITVDALTKVTFNDASLSTIVDEFIADYEDFTGITLTKEAGEPQAGAFNFTLEAPDTLLGEEGYTMDILADRVNVASVSITGNMYGMQTILQMVKTDATGFAIGQMRDYPRFEVRGFMLDIARKPVGMEMIREISRTMRYYKMNDFQLHLSDNYIFLEQYGHGENENEAFKAYEAFRLESHVTNDAGESPTAKDYFITKDEMRTFIQSERALGMNIIPEIDLPAHATSFTKIWPELMVQNKVSPLNSSRPLVDHIDVSKQEAVDKIKEIFNDYTLGENPTFDSETTVHVGADEFVTDYTAYRNFVNAIVPHVKETNQVRMWGGLTWIDDGETEIITDAIENVEMNLWSSAWADGIQMYNMGYKLINTIDTYNYMVPNGNMGRGAYGDLLNINSVFAEFTANRVSTRNGWVTIPSGDDQVLGTAYAIWNDNIDKSTAGLTESDLYWRFFDALPVYAEKNWAATGQEKGSAAAITELAQTLGTGPRTNPYYQAEADVNGVHENYEFDGLEDASANNRDLIAGTATIENGTLVLSGGNSYAGTPIDKIGNGNELSFDITLTKIPEAGQILFETTPEYGTHDIRIMDDGKLGFTRELHDYYFDYELPVGKKVNIRIVAKQQDTLLYVNGTLIGEAVGKYVHNDIVKKTGIVHSTFAIPVERIGSATNAVSAVIDNVVVKQTVDVVLYDKAGWSGNANTETVFNETEGLLRYAFDGRSNTIWHSNWQNGVSDKLTGSNSFYAEIDFGQTYQINQFSFTPRTNQASGIVTKADLYIKENASDEWKLVGADVVFANNAAKKTFYFEEQLVRYVKFVAKQSNDGWVAVSEFDIANLPEPMMTIYVESTTGGTVTGTTEVRTGTNVTVTATANEGYMFEGWYNSVGEKVSEDAEYTFTANKNVALVARFFEAGVTLDSEALTLEEEQTATLVATVTPEGTTVTWISDNEAVATVDENGVVTAVSVGTAVITVTTAEGASASCTVTVTEKANPLPPTQEELVRSFVERMYTIILGRDADPNGLNDWAAGLIEWRVDGAGIVNGFANSEEFVARNLSDEDFIKTLYLAVLNREADEAGLADWLRAFELGYTRQMLIDGFVTSAEFIALCESYGILAEITQRHLVTSFVERMYTVALDREADAAGLEYWVTKLMVGSTDGKTVVNGFVGSPEFEARGLSDEEFIKTLYRTILGREANEADVASWIAAIELGQTRAQIMDGFIVSAEFAYLCDGYGISAILTQRDLVTNFVSRMYTVALGREADANGLNDWVTGLIDGVIYGAQVADGFIMSPEFAARNLSNEDYIKTLYLTFFNREAGQADVDGWVAAMTVHGQSRRDVLRGFINAEEFRVLCEEYGIIRGELAN